MGSQRPPAPSLLLSRLPGPELPEREQRSQVPGLCQVLEPEPPGPWWCCTLAQPAWEALPRAPVGRTAGFRPLSSPLSFSEGALISGRGQGVPETPKRSLFIPPLDRDSIWASVSETLLKPIKCGHIVTAFVYAGKAEACPREGCSPPTTPPPHHTGRRARGESARAGACKRAGVEVISIRKMHHNKKISPGGADAFCAPANAGNQVLGGGARSFPSLSR